MIPRHVPFVLRVLALVGPCLAAGCGGDPKTYPVEGKVTFPDGTTLVGATVEFEAEDAAAAGRNARGTVGADGRYRLTTFKDGDGAVEGPHRVLVVPPSYEPSNMEGPPPKQVLSPNCSKYETSGLRFTVKPETNTYDITVQRP
jgi:hypothetical protein